MAKSFSTNTGKKLCPTSLSDKTSPRTAKTVPGLSCYPYFQEFCSHPQVSHLPSFLLENAGSSTGVKFGKSGLGGLRSLSPPRPSSSRQRTPQAFELPQDLLLPQELLEFPQELLFPQELRLLFPIQLQPLLQEFPPQNSNNNRMIQFIGSSTYHCFLLFYSAFSSWCQSIHRLCCTSSSLINRKVFSSPSSASISSTYSSFAFVSG